MAVKSSRVRSGEVDGEVGSGVVRAWYGLVMYGLGKVAWRKVRVWCGRVS